MTNPSFHGYRTLRSCDLTLLYRKGEIRRIFIDQTQVVNPNKSEYFNFRF